MPCATSATSWTTIGKRKGAGFRCSRVLRYDGKREKFVVFRRFLLVVCRMQEFELG